jgi:hypothetical protein
MHHVDEESGQERCQRLIIVVDVDTEAFGITRAMRNVATHAVRDALEHFNFVTHTSAVRTEVDGSAEIAF